MSTAEMEDIECLACQRSWAVPIYRGLRIGALPHVRAALLRGDWQIFTCPRCGARVQAHRYPVIYTDFPRGIYIAVEAVGADPAAALAAHKSAFDACFTLGPDVAEELGQSLRPRLVFGIGALREKLLILEGGLDDVSLEAVKGDVLRAEGLGTGDVELRLLTVLDGGHLLLAKVAPVRPDPDQPGGLRLAPARAPLGFVTVQRWRYDRRVSDRAALLQDWPQLRDGWIVDLSVAQ